MIVECVYSNDRPNEINFPKTLLPANGKFANHLNSTPQDNLIELAGKTCYDSLTNPKGRGSKEYHEHINEVGHSSVQGHVGLTLETYFNRYDRHNLAELMSVALDLLNRPGVSVESNLMEMVDDIYFRVTANIRAIREWKKFGLINERSVIGQSFQKFATEVCPFAMTGVDLVDKHPDSHINWKVVAPRFDSEIYVSYFFSGLSRNWSHEHIRHVYQAAISQRSTRYVDESESPWALHPIVQKYWIDLNRHLGRGSLDKLSVIDNHIFASQRIYKDTVEFLEGKLIEEGMDKFTARKTSRGGARGVLGGALGTEMIYTASLQEWKEIIRQRCNDGADSEIRLATSKVFTDLLEKYSDRFGNFVSRPAKDGFGLHLELANG